MPRSLRVNISTFARASRARTSPTSAMGRGARANPSCASCSKAPPAPMRCVSPIRPRTARMLGYSLPPPPTPTRSSRSSSPATRRARGYRHGCRHRSLHRACRWLNVPGYGRLASRRHPRHLGRVERNGHRLGGLRGRRVRPLSRSGCNWCRAGWELPDFSGPSCSTACATTRCWDRRTALKHTAWGRQLGTARAIAFYSFKVIKRSSPTLTLSAAGHWAFYNPTISAFVTWVTVSPQLSVYGAMFDVSGIGGNWGCGYLRPVRTQRNRIGPHVLRRPAVGSSVASGCRASSRNGWRRRRP